MKAIYGALGEGAVSQPTARDVGHETSVELVHVRRILGYAQTALSEFDRHREARAKGYERTVPDPDTAAMTAALETCVSLLDRWRRTGRIRQNANYPDEETTD